MKKAYYYFPLHSNSCLFQLLLLISNNLLFIIISTYVTCVLCRSCVQKDHRFYEEPFRPLHASKDHGTGPYPVQVEFSPSPHNVFKIYFNDVSSGSPTVTMYVFFISTYMLHVSLIPYLPSLIIIIIIYI
jgi:hypothetical protein